MTQLVTGLILIAVFFLLLFMLKSGYDKKKVEDKNRAGKDG